jgi:hypothetical protein
LVPLGGGLVPLGGGLVPLGGDANFGSSIGNVLLRILSRLISTLEFCPPDNTVGGFADCKPGELGKFPKTEGGAFWGKAPAGPSEVEVVIDPPEAEAEAEMELDPLEVAGAVDVVSEEDFVSDPSEAADVVSDAAGADVVADPEVLPDALGVLGLT